MPIKRKNTRFIEISNGLFLILSVLSILASILLNFDYTIPNATFEEDISFLSDSIASQKISAVFWLISGGINLFFMPFYLILFYRFQKGMHIFNGFLILLMAWAFCKIGIYELDIANTVTNSTGDPQWINTISASVLLPKINYITLYQKISMCAFGAFATVFTASKFNPVKFPVIGSTLAFLAGPVIIAFVWINSDHIILTAALALALIGLLLIAVKMVNKGLIPKTLT